MQRIACKSVAKDVGSMKILFVCHGNICRSPMAEFIMKDLCKNENYIIESFATSYEEIGNDLYYLAKDVLKKNNIPYKLHKARRITKEDFNSADYVIVMDDNNLYNLKRIVGINSKIYKLNNFIGSNKDIDDPWYTRRFDECFKEIKTACIALKEKLDNK